MACAPGNLRSDERVISDFHNVSPATSGFQQAKSDGLNTRETRIQRESRQHQLEYLTDFRQKVRPNEARRLAFDN
jgi:hypothetical protein